MKGNTEYGILLVEDNPDDVFLIKRTFEKAKILNPIYVVQDGEEAIFYLERKRKYAKKNGFPYPTLILLDLKLPKKSGFEVLKFIKSREKFKRIPVVVLTSSSESPDINKAYDLGANSYLVKPVSFGDLLKMIRILGLYWMVLNEKPEIFWR